MTEKIQHECECTTNTLRQAVQAGADLLDVRYPNWFMEIDLSILNFDTTINNSVLGQLYGGECLWHRRLGLDIRESLANYGFKCPSLIGICCVEEYDRELAGLNTEHFTNAIRWLKKLWIIEIQARLKEQYLESKNKRYEYRVGTVCV